MFNNIKALALASFISLVGLSVPASAAILKPEKGARVYLCTESSPYVNGRSGPGLNYPIIRKVPINVLYPVVEIWIGPRVEQPHWTRIKVGNVLVWVHGHYTCQNDY